MFVEPSTNLNCVSHQMVQCCVTRIGSKHYTDKETAYIFHVYHHYLFVHYVPSLTLYINKVPQKWIDSLHALC